MAAMDPKLVEALGPYKGYFDPQEDGKLKCLVNGHCFPANRPEQIAAFVNGARFAKLKVRYDAETALTKYEPFIVISKNFPHMLYCALTGQLLEKSLAAVKKHMGGKRFVRARARFVADQQDLKPEPSLKEFGIVLPGEEDDKKKRKQRKKGGEGEGNGDEEMQEADGSDDDEDGEGEEGGSDSDQEPEFWVPPGEEGGSERSGLKKAQGPDAMDEDEVGGDVMEEEEDEGASGSGSGDMLEEQEEEQAGPSGRGVPAPAPKAGGKKAASSLAANGGAPRQNGSSQQQQQQQPKQQPKQQNKQQQGKGEQQGTQQAGQQRPGTGAAAAGGKPGKLSKRQKKKLVAAAAQEVERAADDFDFDAEAHEGAAGDHGGDTPGPAVNGSAEEAAQGQQQQQQPKAAGAGKPAKKKNVNRPAPAKKARH